MHKGLSGRAVAQRARASGPLLLALLLLGIWQAPGRAHDPEAERAVPEMLAPAGPDFVPATGRTEPTYAWAEFCRRMPAECEVDRSEPALIPFTREILQVLQDVTLEVNRAIVPVTDRDYWGVEDRWDFPDDGYGDCEDIQLLKRKRLIAVGLPRRALRMTVVLNREGEGHAVLMVRTTSGDFILDNSTSAVLPWHQTGYRFFRREGQDGRQWTKLLEAPSPATVASR